MLIQDIMQTNVITINPDATIKEISKTLVENNISGVFVVNADDKLVGVVSEGDLLHKETNPRPPGAFGLLGAIIYYRGVKQYESDFKKLIALKASEIMTSDIIKISPEANIEEAASIMVNKQIKRLPVMMDEEIIGVVTRRDIIKTLMQD